MLSYRHAFHAGNHADVLKHSVLLALLQYLKQKDGGVLMVDTHSGAGLYRLDKEQALTSGESLQGIHAVRQAAANKPDKVPEMVQAYLDMMTGLHPEAREGELRHYPGSPWIMQSALRPQDSLKVFEVHPSDARLLERNVAELDNASQIQLNRKDGFTGLKALLPPPSRRALVLMDPSYELKHDYASVVSTMEDALRRFATGTYAIWYPVIGRQEAHSLPKKLKSLAQTAGRSWLHTTLSIGADGAAPTAESQRGKTKMRASGMFVINPPYTLESGLRESLPWLVKAIGLGKGQGFTLESGEGR
ncbi:23S rRNA (adenine(2030)-N(6))-methyltransferase RlmJ [Hydrogenophaga sp. 5NK40-0174]|uniref:23S rRNA (adenine(2030)-N(6))-methyltransferase RlmJ n=1 Tax=Hydrogenophaga sp. 5NK40-0174 TaxID=3127649 RepID=UPI00310BFC04